MQPQEGIHKLLDRFGSRIGMLGHMVITLSMTGQPCDITFFKKKPALDVKIDPKINIALMYGAGADKFKEMLDNISLSNGELVSINEIWGIHPMPSGGISEQDLAAVDLSAGDQVAGPNGESIRQIIRETYHCESKDEEDRFLRRYLAS